MELRLHFQEADDSVARHQKPNGLQQAPDVDYVCAHVGLLEQEIDAFINDLDLEGFRREISDLGSKLASEQGPADIAHLNKICMWR